MVEQFGKFDKLAEPGCNFVWPCIGNSFYWEPRDFDQEECPGVGLGLGFDEDCVEDNEGLIWLSHECRGCRLDWM